MLLYAILIALAIISSTIVYLTFFSQNIDNNHACIIVLGDIGRSPRSMYHALSFAENGYKVTLIGYGGSQPIDQLTSHQNVVIKEISIPNTKNMSFVLSATLKILAQVFGIIKAFYSDKSLPKWTLVQSPPSIPTLYVAQLLAITSGTKLIIDWHNTAYSLLALKFSPSHPIVKISQIIEEFTGKIADIHIFVTNAMRIELSKQWNLIGRKVTLHDKAPSLFKRLTYDERSEFLKSIKLIDDDNFVPSPDENNIETSLVVSSTSWTQDEDFSMLLTALQRYEVHAHQKSLPKMLVAITGKGGPLKTEFEEKIKELERQWNFIRVRTIWMEAKDYPKLLGSAHLGLSFHTSSSGLDLPMKVVDMFGAGLPACALNFKCLHELVINDINGLTFESGNQLGDQLIELFDGKPNKLSKLRSNLTETPTTNWSDNWNSNLLYLIKG